MYPTAIETIGRGLVSDYVKRSHVVPDRLLVALQFLDALPTTAATPMSGFQDGEIGFWWENQAETMSLLVVPRRDTLRFTAEFGRERKHGLVKFDGESLPVIVSELIGAFSRRLDS
jgi:hypothetical protein